MLLKPFVRGVSLGELYRRHGDRLPADMLSSLKDLYDYVQAVGDRVRVKQGFGTLAAPKAGKGVGLALDGRAANIVWVEDAVTLRTLGFSRPSFLFVELDQAIGNSGQYLAHETSFADYAAELVASGRDEASRQAH